MKTDDPDRLEAAYVPPDVGFCDQTTACDEEWLHTPSPCLYHSSGLPAIRSTVLAISNSNYAGRAKAMCSGSAAPACISILGQAAIRRRQGRGHRPDAALVRLETPVGGGRNQRTAAA